MALLLLCRLDLLGLGDQQGVLEHHLKHGGRVSGGGKASSAGEAEVKGKGGVGRAGSDVHQVLVLLILGELAIGSADLELWGGKGAKHALHCKWARPAPVQVPPPPPPPPLVFSLHAELCSMLSCTQSKLLLHHICFLRQALLPQAELT